MSITIDQITERARKTMGIGELNEMQRAVAATSSKDIILIAPTGSGKTLAFAIETLKRLDNSPSGTTRAIIVAPSRELVIQIYNVVRAMALPLKTVAVYGGRPMTSEKGSLTPAPDILVATPGRLLDHLDNKHIDLSAVQLAVIDEYDKSLELGFQEQMSRIVSTVRDRRRECGLMLTSATRLADVPDFVDLSRAQVIDMSDTTDPRSRMMVMNVPSPSRDKLDTLTALLRTLGNGPVMVFVNHRESAERVVNHLNKQKVDAVLYHGGLEQRDREIAVSRLSAGTSPVMVTTDLGGRGLDIDGVRAVVHYHMPVNEQTWTHRNGRTARVDNAGEVYVISGPEENVPEYITTDHDFYPDMTLDIPVRSDKVMLYVDAGKRDKISRGDLAGFVMKVAAVPADEVGAITVTPTYSLVAVARSRAKAVINAAGNSKVKNKKVRISLLD